MKIIGHRGASWARPENTAAAFELALQEGAEGLELDLQLTRDGQVVVFHDKTLSMLGLKHRRISQYRRDELRSLDVGAWFGAAYSGESILDLDEVLERYGRRTELYLEIKPVGEAREPQRALQLAQAVAARLAAHADLNRLYVLSFSDAVLAEVASSHRALRCVRNVEFPAQLAAIDAAALARLHAVCVDIRRFWPADLEVVRAAGRAVYAYTVDAPKHLKMAQQMRLDAIICNGPAAARAALQQLAQTQRQSD